MLRTLCLLVVLGVVACAVDHTGLGPVAESDARVDTTSVDANAGRDAGPPPDGAVAECNPGDQRFCGIGLGACVRGEERCEAGRWSECRGAVGPTMEVCDALSVDEDCDGMANEDCPCTPGETLVCNTDMGECSVGEIRCGADARWGECSTPPGVPETCNMLDDDCDGSTDETVLLPFYPDGDGDTFGVGATVTQACEMPPLHAARAGDCDDTEITVNPDATELCNGRNDDCDALIDEGLTFADYFVDGDRDGYGTGPAIPFCMDPGAEFASMDGDCNDASSAARPGLSETCDTLNNDCSGTIDDGGACGAFCSPAVHGDHVYLFCHTGGYDWGEANDYCNGAGGGGHYRLVVVDGPEEQLFLTAQAMSISATDSWWLGFTDRDNEGTFVWVDGTPWTYDNFAAGEPNNSRNEDCAVMYASGQWNDDQCWNDQSFICETIDSI